MSITAQAGMFAAPQATSSPHPVGVGGLGEVAFALIIVLAEDVPMFRGSFGLSRGQQAIKFEERIRRSSVTNPENLPVKRN